MDRSSNTGTKNRVAGFSKSSSNSSSISSVKHSANTSTKNRDQNQILKECLYLHYGGPNITAADYFNDELFSGKIYGSDTYEGIRHFDTLNNW